jgi:hypothetical protein
MMPPPKPYIIRLLIFLAVLSLCHITSAQTVVKGRVIDASTKEAMPFANIRFKGTAMSGAGGQTDADGYFNFKMYEKTDSMIVSYTGYITRTIGIKRGQSQELTVEITDKAIELHDVIINPGKHKHHIDTPALYVYHQVVKHKKFNKSEAIDDYKLHEYQKILIGVVNPKIWFLKLRILRPFAFALENRDTTADSTVVIPALLKEDLVDVYYRKNPQRIRRITTGTKFTGIKNNSLGSLLNYTFDKIDIYDEVFVILNKSFVGPFANGAFATTYDYFITDTVRKDGRTAYKLHFVGKSNVDVALKGYAWIDSASWAVKSINFRPNEHANLNYLKDYNIAQTYSLIDNKTWMLTSEDVQTEATIIKKSEKNQMGIIVRKHMSRRDIQIDVPIDDTIFGGADKEIILPEAHFKTREWWDTMRFDPLTISEVRLIKIHDTIKSVPAYKHFYWVIKLFSTAKLQFWKVDVGRVYKFVSENSVEGVRLRIGAETNEFFSTRYHIFGYAAYGLRDHVFRYNVTAHFPLPEKNDLWRQFEFHYQYDLNQLGAQSQFLTFDNITSLLNPVELSKIMNIREWEMSLANEWIHSFTSNMLVHNSTYYDLPGIFDFRIKNSEGQIVHLPSFNTFEVGIENRYSYNEKYYRSGFYRYFVTTKAPVFLLNYYVGALNMDGKESIYNKFQLTMVHRLAWLLGHTWYSVGVGKVIGKSPYPISFVTGSGQGYFLNNFDYNMLTQFEFVTDQYVSWYIEHHFDGYFLNKIPYVQRLKLREVIYMRGLWGSYSQSNYDALLPGFDFKSPSAYPYMEAGVGVENIFKVLRFDSIWRLTYRNNKAAANWEPKVSLSVIF